MNESANYRVWLAGPQVFGQGYGTEITQLVVDYALSTCGLHRVSLGVYDFNPRAQRVYEKCGFRHEGRLRHTTAFASRNVLYHYGPEKLIIGKFRAIGEGVRFIMNAANHRMDGPSTFPFPIMGGSWSEHVDLITGLPGRGDTVIGKRRLARA